MGQEPGRRRSCWRLQLRRLSHDEELRMSASSNHLVVFLFFCAAREAQGCGEEAARRVASQRGKAPPSAGASAGMS
ncbi:unnamed protein product [Urochloa humidicola]